MPIYTCIILCTLPIHQLITFQSINLLSHFFFLTSSLKPVLIKSSIYVTTIKTNNYLMSTSSRQPISYNSYVYPHIVMLICTYTITYTQSINQSLFPFTRKSLFMFTFYSRFQSFHPRTLPCPNVDHKIMKQPHLSLRLLKVVFVKKNPSPSPTQT